MARQSNTAHDDENRRKKPSWWNVYYEYFPREKNNYWMEKSVTNENYLN